MIDLEKEKKDFIKVYTEIYGEHDQIWQGWKKRAELAQQEISHLKNANHHLNEINEDISNTILYLREKLTKYESDGVVVMPRKINQGMYEAMNNNLRGCCGGVCIYEEEAWEEMIEAGEIK